VSENGSKKNKRETLYSEIRISDSQLIPPKWSRGKDGHQVETVSFWKIENSYNLRMEDRDFLHEHDLLGPF
jgi:hypothetical protein